MYVSLLSCSHTQSSSAAYRKLFWQSCCNIPHHHVLRMRSTEMLIATHNDASPDIISTTTCHRVCVCVFSVSSVLATVPLVKARRVLHFAVYLQ